MPASDGSAPSLTNLDQALTVPEEEPAPISAEPAPTTPEGPRDTLLAPGQSVNPSEPARLPQIAPVTDPDIAVLPPDPVPEPAVDLAPAQSPASTLQDNRPTLPPSKPLQNKLPATVQDKVVPGVKTGNLPQIGAAKEAATVPTDAANIPPVQKFARQFDNAAQKPLFVILLHDVGSAGMRREDLATLPFPVSFVVDPLATDAKDASAAYRAAGQEVLTLANGIPPGATANDLETTFQTLSGILPESVAVIDQENGGFQDRRLLATLVLPVIKGEGRGLVTYDRGLNAADQIARRDGVPSTVIFRRLDAEDENKSTIRRYLDRAAFKAAQDGLVVVIGDTRAETVASILEWTVEGKASTVTLAPVTAVLGR
ncbi:MAG: divergent polysaccharide deacetylase family protein [Candidatus Saccharibacteria bacterium]|nr:divergent polysaccharide deacetylase family protein [Pseudorhodobacter sp.]